MLRLRRREGIVKELRTNRMIRAKEVLLIGKDGEQLGLTPLFQAIALARQHNLDLVEVAANANPPVCKLLDYGKYRYEHAKKEREQSKGQRTSLREVRLRIKIQSHDLESKIRLVKRLLNDGDKVKVSVVFRGREITHPELGRDLLRKVLSSVKEEAIVDKSSLGDASSFKKEERNMILILSPAKRAKEKRESAEDKDS